MITSRCDKCESLKEEVADLRASLIHAVDLQRASQDNGRQLSAMRHVANSLSVPFSHARVQERYDSYKVDERISRVSDVERDALVKLNDFLQSYAEECVGVPAWVDVAQRTVIRLAEIGAVK